MMSRCLLGFVVIAESHIALESLDQVLRAFEVGGASASANSAVASFYHAVGQWSVVSGLCIGTRQWSIPRVNTELIKPIVTSGLAWTSDGDLIRKSFARQGTFSSLSRIDLVVVCEQGVNSPGCFGNDFFKKGPGTVC